MRRCFTFVLVLMVPGLGLAQPAGLATLSQRSTRLETHRGRLEQLLSAQTLRIGRLKAQRPGVRRDFQLKRTLRDSQALATRLTKLQDQLRDLNGRLVKAYDRAIAAAVDPTERARLLERRAQLTRKAAARARIVTQEKASPLDSAEDLEEKADLLKDSEEKVRTQLRTLRAQIARLQHQARLRRHSRAVDDSPFVEDSPRRTVRAKSSTAAAPKETDDSAASPADGKSQDTSAPVPAAPPSPGAYTDSEPDNAKDNSLAGAGTWTSKSAGESAGTPATPTLSPDRAAGGGGSLSVTIRDVMDPSVLQELKRAQKSGTLAERIAALKKAEKRLKEVARKLGTQASQLRKRAKSVR
jgi:TolA-binding protein